MKGIILAGGRATRLYPATKVLCKQLLPIFDKPMIYYPLSILLLAGIRDILLISTPEDTPRFTKLLGDGHDLGIHLSYAVQDEAIGLADAFIIGKNFIENDHVALILGDNLFYGNDLPSLLQRCVKDHTLGGLIFGYHVQDPERYSVLEFDANFAVSGIEEKPKIPKSSYAVPGLYFYDKEVVSIAENLQPSSRGELEITDVNLHYLMKKKLQVQILGRGFAWLDTGTFDALQKASLFVQTIQERQGIKIACLEEIAYRMGYIDEKKVLELALEYPEMEYRSYLQKLIQSPGHSF